MDLSRLPNCCANSPIWLLFAGGCVWEIGNLKEDLRLHVAHASLISNQEAIVSEAFFNRRQGLANYTVLRPVPRRRHSVPPGWRDN